jgi:hypothetical protein
VGWTADQEGIWRFCGWTAASGAFVCLDAKDDGYQDLSVAAIGWIAPPTNSLGLLPPQAVSIVVAGGFYCAGRRSKSVPCWSRMHVSMQWWRPEGEEWAAAIASTWDAEAPELWMRAAEVLRGADGAMYQGPIRLGHHAPPTTIEPGYAHVLSNAALANAGGLVRLKWEVPQATIIEPECADEVVFVVLPRSPASALPSGWADFLHRTGSAPGENRRFD